MVKEFYTSEAARWVGITKTNFDQKTQKVESLTKDFVEQNKELVFFGSIATAMVAAVAVVYYFWLPLMLIGGVILLIRMNKQELMQSFGSFTSDVTKSARSEAYGFIWKVTEKATRRLSPYGNAVVNFNWTEVGESIQKVEQATQVEKAENPNLVEVDEESEALEKFYQENVRDSSIDYEVF